MKKQIKKAISWLMLVCMIVSFMPAFGSAAALEEKRVQSIAWSDSDTDPAAAQSEGELEGLRSDNIFDLLVDVFKAIVKNLKSLSTNELLNLPANSMDDVVTYIFAFFKLFGVRLDALYEKLAVIF